MVTHYNGSKGPMLISAMPYSYLKNARDKLVREQPDRSDEIEAMTARLTELEVDGEATPAKPVAEAVKPFLDPADESRGPGDNNPPEPTDFDSIKARVEQLMVQVKPWTDGKKIEDQEQADTVAGLMDVIRRLAKNADEARKVENDEFDKGKAAVQAKYAPLIADTKAQRGVTVVALEGLKGVLTPWLQKLEADQKAAAEAKRVEAEKLTAAATDAFRNTDLTDLGARETAFGLVHQAGQAQADAKKLDGARAHAQGGGRATSLRSYWTPALTDPKAALMHYLATRSDDIKAVLQRLAEEDVRGGVRTIPGFSITEDRRVA